MINERIVWLKINNSSYYNVLTKLNNIGITLYDNKKENDYILIKTTYDDYKRIKKYLVSYDVSLYDVSGILKIKKIVKKYQIFAMAIVLSIVLLIVVNNMIFKIEVKSANKNIQKLVLNELKNNGIKTLRFKINHKKIEVIVNNILENNKDTLEWLEIRYDGLVMIVNVTEKTKALESKDNKHCHIIANTDAKITSLNIYRGVALKEINDYVLKGDIILSGDIIHNEEVKNVVCASGEVYGEVWYKVKVEVPFKEEVINYTGKNRYNLNIKYNDNKYTIFKSRIENKKEKDINLYKLNGFEINLVKEKEYVIKTKILTENEAYNKALKLVEDNILLKLDENEEILLKKVLKKEVNDSTIYVEVFVVTKENIGIIDVVEEEILNDNDIDTESSE